VWRARWSPLEDGVVDFARLLAALHEVGYDGWLGLEDFSRARPTLEALRHNIKFVKDLLNKPDRF
jgi:sugar phosphate isomerase/epimerase